ncbi:hypothetical protein F1880_008792, partial [Penicillium rolfsii]
QHRQRSTASRVTIFCLKDASIASTKTSFETIRLLESLEAKTFAREKGLLDYTYLLRACESIDTAYTVMLEDDVIALDGWYNWTKIALSVAEQKTIEESADKWLYLRLFYAEQFLGWNSEEWPAYLLSSLLTALLVGATATASRHCRPAMTAYLPSNIITVLADHNTFNDCRGARDAQVRLLFSWVGLSTGPHQKLVSWYESKRIGYFEMLTESYADENNELRWAPKPGLYRQ